MQPVKGTCFQRDQRCTIVNELSPVCIMTREELESLQQLNPRLIEMRAGDRHYLAEPPIKS